MTLWEDRECQLASDHHESEYNVRQDHEQGGFLIQLIDCMEAQTQMVDDLATCVSQVPIVEPS